MPRKRHTGRESRSSAGRGGGVLPPNAAGLEGADARLLQVVDSRLREGAERAGGALACRSGCTDCCFGPFPISRLDAWRLRRGLEELFRRDPARADATLSRARDAVRILSEGFPGDAARGLLDGDDAAEDAHREGMGRRESNPFQHIT